MSRVYFPLQTSVELFGDRETPKAITRVKQAAALYDEVFIEDGLYTASVSTEGSDSWWHPWASVHPEQLARTRTPIEPGAPVAVGMQVQPGPDQPGEGPVHWTSQGTLLIDYAAEFRTGIIDELVPLDPDWLTVISLGHQSANQPPEVRSAIKKMNQADFFDHDLMRDRNTFERGFISKSFNHDAAWAARLDATFNVTPLFLPKLGLERAGLTVDYAGGVAFELLVPNVGVLPWEAILEFRNHPGHQEARAKLRELEEAAADREPGSVQDFKLAVQAELNGAFFEAINDLKPSLPESIAAEVGKTLIGLIPVAGQIGSGIASAAEIARDELAYRKTWHAALLKLHSAAR